MKKTIVILFMFHSLSLLCQVVFVNNGQNIIFNNDVNFIVKNGDLNNEGGLIKNEGHTHIEGNLVNNAKIEGGNVNSEFFVLNDWENNGIFNANQSTVFLNGANQNIKGIQESNFNNLSLENGSVKTLDLNSSVSGVLNLTNSELATTNYKMFVSNSDVNAIQFNENIGFVSSIGNGRLIRNTNSTNSYIFPTGEDIGSLKYRPIRIKPQSGSSNQFEVRFVNSNADYDGYDFNLKDSRIKSFNESFYHLINQSLGNDDSKLNIYYIPSEDGDWKGIAQWETKWTDLGKTNSNDYNDFKEISYINWMSNKNEPHILINIDDCKLAIPTAFSPNSSLGKNDGFGALKTCDLSSYEMNIFDRWGELIFTSNDINNSWDGTYKGYKAEIGVYSYYIDYSLKGNNESKQEKGSITLLR